MKKNTLVVGTKNPDKRREIEQLLSGSGIQVLTLDDFPGCAEAEETGRSFLANAKLKARFYGQRTGLLTLADDSGLVVPALKGRPGVYSARFAGPSATYEDNNRKLLGLLSGKPSSSRRAKFVCVMALYQGKKYVGAVRGECPGRIADAPRGQNGFGYDPVFIPEGLSKTFAELSQAKKNSISHRSRALRAAAGLILSL